MEKYTEEIIVSNPKLVSHTEALSEVEGIYTTIRAISANKITRNKTFYPREDLIGDKKKTGYVSMVSPYQIPIITNHNAQPSMFSDTCDDPMGRVIAARFVPEGEGYIECVAHITDWKGMEMITSSRYLTVSIGASCESVTCSVCGKEVMGGCCEDQHYRGQFYKTSKGKDVECYHKVHGVQFHEISFVNVPSDNEAKVLQVDDTPGNLKHFAKSDEGYKDLNNSMFYESLWCDGQDSDVARSAPEEERMSTEKVLSLGELYALPETDNDYAIEADAEIKDLKTASFCGPKRTFPSHSKESVLSGLRLLNRSTLSEALKAKTEEALFRKGKSYGIGSNESVLVVCSADDRILDLTREEWTPEGIASLVTRFNIEGAELAMLRTILKLESEMDEQVFGEGGTVGTNPAIVATAYPLFRELSNEDFDTFVKEREPVEEAAPQAEKCTDEYYTLLSEYDELNDRVTELEQKLATALSEKELAEKTPSYEKEYRDLLISIVAEASVNAGATADIKTAMETYADKSLDVLKELIPIFAPLANRAHNDAEVIQNPDKLEVADPRPHITEAAIAGASPQEIGKDLVVMDEEDTEGISLYTLVFRKEEKPTP